MFLMCALFDGRSPLCSPLIERDPHRLAKPIEGLLVDIQVLVTDMFFRPHSSDLGAFGLGVRARHRLDLVDRVEPPLEVEVAEEREEVLRRPALFVHELPDLRSPNLVDDLVLVIELDEENGESLRGSSVSELVDHESDEWMIWFIEGDRRGLAARVVLDVRDEDVGDDREEVPESVDRFRGCRRFLLLSHGAPRCPGRVYTP